jgi:glycerol-3-phosphate acyltransferase PlsY
LIVYLLTQYVSLAAVTCSVTYAVLFVVFQHQNPVVMTCGVLIGLLAVFQHRGNIARLVKGQERKTNLFGKGKQK